MNISRIMMLVAAMGLTGSALAGEEAKTRIAIAVVDDSSDGEVRIELDSDTMGFNLHDMQEGENRSIVDKSGRTILVTRNEDGFTFDVDGKSIDMPAFDGAHHGSIWLEGDHSENVDVKVLHKMHKMGGESATSMDGIMIMSGKPVDDATQQAIKSLLESAGHGSEVHFVDHDGPHGGPHSVRVIKKQVEKTQ